ncbi:MAG: chemotaxis protein CheB [Deltaproteobacteria bacterium]|nr:chemotaxis protein CheB [Deltaproteobacteria bacterium]
MSTRVHEPPTRTVADGVVRVAVVDASLEVRRAVAAGLGKAGGFEVLGTAVSARSLAFGRLCELGLDRVVVLATAGGDERLRVELDEIIRRLPGTPILVLGGPVTLAPSEAAFVSRVALPGPWEARVEQVVAEVVGPSLGAPRAAVVAERRGPRRPSLKPDTVRHARPDIFLAPPPARVSLRVPRVEVLVLASSTGGPNALGQVIPSLPADLPVPVLIVQHMPAGFTRNLAERLDERAQLRVREAEGGELLAPGTVWIAPGDRHLTVVRDGAAVRTQLDDGPRVNSCRPAADVLFASAAVAFGAGTLGAVLTGMGRDGLDGARAVTAAGGRVLAQSGETCVVWGMPRAVEEAGLAHALVPLDDLGARLTDAVLGRDDAPVADVGAT